MRVEMEREVHDYIFTSSPFGHIMIYVDKRAYDAYGSSAYGSHRMPPLLDRLQMNAYSLSSLQG